MPYMYGTFKPAIPESIVTEARACIVRSAFSHSNLPSRRKRKQRRVPATPPGNNVKMRS